MSIAANVTSATDAAYQDRVLIVLLLIIAVTTVLWAVCYVVVHVRDWVLISRVLVLPVVPLQQPEQQLDVPTTCIPNRLRALGFSNLRNVAAAADVAQY